jgi:TIR domain
MDALAEQSDMPYVPDFINDLFVSYGHIDDSPLGEGKRGFVSRFHADLQRRVNQYLGTEVKIWRDNELGENVPFPPEIERNLRGAAAWIPVLSPRFLNSPWCQREQSIFLNAVEGSGGVKVGTRSRIFKVVTTLVDLSELPDTMQQVLGYEFGRFDDRGRWRAYDYDPAADAEKLYLAKLDDVAYDLHLLLKEMKQLKEREPSPAVKPINPPVSPNESVYLAETTKELSDSRAQIRRELLANGYQVLPDGTLPFEVNELSSVVSRQLESCRLSVHLIGGSDGVVPGDQEGELSHARMQEQLAVQRRARRIQQELAFQRRAKGNFDCLLWVPLGAEVSDDDRSYLDQLQEQLRAHNAFEILKTPLETLKSYIFDKLRVPPKGPVPKPDQPHIYFICEQRDLDSIRPIKEYLAKQGFGVDTPLMKGDQTVIRQDHEGFLQDCDGVLIYHGVGSEAWLREKIRDLRRARGLGRQRPFMPQAIYVGPDSTDGKKAYENDEFLIMRNFGDFCSDSIQPFLKVAA